MLFSKRNLKKFLSLSLFDKVFILAETSHKLLQKKMNFKGKYTLWVDNRKNFNNLLIIIAGYQEYTWNCIFNRIKKYLEIPADVIIVSNGKFCEHLKSIALKYGRSYLSTKDNKVALGFNIAIKIHEKADFIYKMDEDVFVTKGLFKNLKDKYDYTLKYGPFTPGGITPVININGFSYINFLKTVGKIEEFKKLFNINGPLKQGVGSKDDIIWYSGDVAEYIWNNTLSIEDIQSKYFDKIRIDEDFTANSIRYSIGCFMFPRRIRERMGGFRVSLEGNLGDDESEYLNFCTNNSLPVILCENSIVGHLSFGPQKKAMEKFFKEKEKYFYPSE